jgi:predicted small metal-binding protein
MSTRKTIDCREHPSVNNCSLKISGTEEEVLKVAVRHAVEEHEHEDTPELQKMLKEGLKDE